MTVLAAGILAFVTGCAGLESPRRGEVEAIKASHKVAVLFRVVTRRTDNLQSQQTGGNPAFFCASLDHVKPDEPDETWSFSLSKASWEQGWRCILLDPGNYCVGIEPGAWRLSNDTNFFCSLCVPEGQPAIYAGSFFFLKKPDRAFDPLRIFFGPIYHVECDGMLDETAKARQIASSPQVQLGDVTPCLARSYDDFSAAFNGITNRHLVGIEGGNTPMASAGTPDDQAVYFDVKPRGRIGLVIDGLSQVGQEPYNTLKHEFTQFALDRRLTGEISNQLSSADSGATQTPSGLILQVRLKSVTFEAAPLEWYALQEWYAPRIRLSVGLFDTREKRTLWKHDCLYTIADKAPNRPEIITEENYYDLYSDISYYTWLNYETAIGPPATPHKFAEYQGPAGARLFHSQLEQAVTDIGDDIAKRFREAGFSE